MKKYLTKNNMRESLREVMNKNEITVEAFDEFVNEAYAYAVECNNSRNFTEKASVMLIKKYMKVSLDAFIDVWSIIAMYCFENLANKLVNTVAVVEDDKEEMKCIALSTIIDAARLYNFDNEYRRMYELSVEETLKRHQQILNDLASKNNYFIEKTYKEVVSGQVEVRQLFKVSKIGTIAGSYVQTGYIERNCGVRLIRDSIIIYTGKLSSLRRGKDDVKEVKTGFECGLTIENYNDIKVGDIIEGFVMEEVK